jgi:hypothetical protein
MRQLHCVKAKCVCLCAAWLLTAGALVPEAHAGQPSEALAADHVIACIQTAVAAQPGLVKEVEAKYRRGQWLCEVDLVDDTGQQYELDVDVTTNRVVKAKRD